MGEGGGLPDLWEYGFELGGLIGIDPRPFTLRELFPMAAGAWDPVAAQMSWLAGKLTGEKIHPVKLNPFRRKVKTPAQKAIENKEGWAALKAGLRAMAGGRR